MASKYPDPPSESNGNKKKRGFAPEESQSHSRQGKENRIQIMADAATAFPPNPKPNPAIRPSESNSNKKRTGFAPQQEMNSHSREGKENRTQRTDGATAFPPKPKPNPAIRTLLKDQQELLRSPIPHVSATPLEDNVFEWHCNIRQDKDTIYHVIMYFPTDFPYSPPSAEFVPSGFKCSIDATEKKSYENFAEIPEEWVQVQARSERPPTKCTVKMVLLKLLSFLSETNRYAESMNKYLFGNVVCDVCGHTQAVPFPAFGRKVTAVTTKDGGSRPSTSNVADLEIVDYITNEKFTGIVSKDSPLFGYGLVLTERGHKSYVTTPCEYLSSKTFYNTRTDSGKIHSIGRKEELSFFLPLYIYKVHGYYITREFEQLLRDIRPILFPGDRRRRSYEETILELIPSLMSSAISEYAHRNKDTRDCYLKGFFSLHRLLLWAKQRYRDLGNLIERKIESFISDPSKRILASCSDLGKWLMLLSVSERFTWHDVSEMYLEEAHKRNVMRYLKGDDKLGDLDTDINYRLTKTFELTEASRNLLVLQVSFLKAANPKDVTLAQIIAHYDQTMGMADATMVSDIENTLKKISSSKITHYGIWYNCLGLHTPSKTAIFDTLKMSVLLANTSEGYYFPDSKKGQDTIAMHQRNKRALMARHGQGSK